ncbi:MAG: ribose-5-phosphate isomerase RpiA [Candidatus Eisenbacteria bacterium]
MTGAPPLSPETAAARDRVAAAALALVEPGMVLGLGTGDSARRFIERLGERAKAERLGVTCVGTSRATEALAAECGLTVRSLVEATEIELAVAGADEVDPALDLIKGGGGALTREKLVAASAARFVVLVDEAKLVRRLGERFALPIEVLTEAVPLVSRRLEELGAVPRVRATADGDYVTDLGNRIVDARFGEISNAAALAARLDAIPGLLEHGLFLGMADLVLVGVPFSQDVRRLVSGVSNTPDQ